MHDPKNGVAVRDNSTSYLNHFPKSFCGYDAVVFLEKCCQISKEEVCGCLCVVFVCVVCVCCLCVVCVLFVFVCCLCVL